MSKGFTLYRYFGARGELLKRNHPEGEQWNEFIHQRALTRMIAKRREES